MATKKAKYAPKSFPPTRTISVIIAIIEVIMSIQAEEEIFRGV